MFKALAIAAVEWRRSSAVESVEKVVGELMLIAVVELVVVELVVVAQAVALVAVALVEAALVAV